MIKILILGGHGMLGHVVNDKLSQNDDFDVHYSVREAIEPLANQHVLDVTDIPSLEKLIMLLKPSIIINCIGILVSDSHRYPDKAIFINAYLPHLLGNLADSIDAKFIHISTDCVFSGEKGGYTENDVKDARDIYGQTKGLGEVIRTPHLSIRTSIIGPELKANGTGLFHWFMQQQHEVVGFEKAIWSGVTTFELSKAIEWAIKKNIKGLYHITNNLPINKFQLLTLFKKHMDKLIDIRLEPGKQVNKSFIDTRNEINYPLPSYQEMIKEMSLYMARNKERYSQYFS